MKHLIHLNFVSVFLLNGVNAFSQAANWQSVVSDGFGNNCNYGVIEFEEFNNYLYASTMIKNGSCTEAEIWRSNTGDSGSWRQLTNFIPPLEPKGIPSFGKTDLGGGIFWLGASNTSKGAIIYRTIDGLQWTAISKRGFGNAAEIVPAPHMLVFKGSNDSIPYLYAGVGSHGGASNGQVWRTPYYNTDSLNWELLVDFSNIDKAVTLISYFYVWNNKLYFCTDGGAQLWESTDGRTFIQNQGVGNGFGVSSNYVIASMVDFNGYLYATTTNKKLGGQLWRTADGTIWESITLNSFGKNDSISELRSLRIAFDKIWLTGYTNLNISKGSPVWYSEDGTNFRQLNTDGFGNVNNNGPNAVVYGFGNYEYFGGPNSVDGAQVWRLQLLDEAVDSTASSIKNLNAQYGYINSIDDFFLNYKHCDIEDMMIINANGQMIYQEKENIELIKKKLLYLNPGLYLVKIVDSHAQAKVFKYIKN